MAADWSDDRIDALKKLWAEGLSGNQIANRLGGGVSRNAVIGKLHRLGLSGRGTGTAKTMRDALRKVPVSQLPRVDRTPSRPKPAMPAMPRLVAEPVAEPVAEVWVPHELRKGLLDLEDGDCRWPIGDPRSDDFHFCGHRKVAGMSYCAMHAARAYDPGASRSLKGRPFLDFRLKPRVAPSSADGAPSRPRQSTPEKESV